MLVLIRSDTASLLRSALAPPRRTAVARGRVPRRRRSPDAPVKLYAYHLKVIRIPYRRILTSAVALSRGARLLRRIGLLTRGLQLVEQVGTGGCGLPVLLLDLEPDLLAVNGNRRGRVDAQTDLVAAH